MSPSFWGDAPRFYFTIVDDHEARAQTFTTALRHERPGNADEGPRHAAVPSAWCARVPGPSARRRSVTSFAWDQCP